MNLLMTTMNWSIGSLSLAAEVAVMLFAIGLVLVVAEVALPTHGILSFLGGLAILGGVGACFVINPWMGLGILLALVISMPFVGTALVKIWPRTPMGRRMVLTEVAGRVTASRPVAVGEIGVTMSELRPMGECEFDGVRVESISEEGLIHPGERVKVVALSGQRPVVQTVI